MPGGGVCGGAMSEINDGTTIGAIFTAAVLAHGDRPFLAVPANDARGFATLTTVAFDNSSLQWLEISTLIAEPEGPSFISRTVTHRPTQTALVTHDPKRTWSWGAAFATGRFHSQDSHCSDSPRLRCQFTRGLASDAPAR